MSGYSRHKDAKGNPKRIRKAFKGPNARELALKYKLELENQELRDDLTNPEDIRRTKLNHDAEILILDMIREIREDLKDDETEGHLLLKKAVDFFLESPTRTESEITPRELYTLFIERRNWKKRSKPHKANFSATVDKFCSYFDSDRNLATITRKEVETFLNRRGKNETSDACFRLEYAHIHALFEYGLKLNHISKNVVHEIEKPELDKKEPVSLTIEQCRKLFIYAEKVDAESDEWLKKRNRPIVGSSVAYYALAIFAALRPFEVRRAEWEDIDWDQGIIRARMRKSGGYTRSVELPKVCLAWLNHVGGKKRKGLITPNNINKRSAVIRAASGFRIEPGNYTGTFGLEAEVKDSGKEDRPEWTNDICRHTGITYRLRDVQDKPAVALWAGNSPEEIERSYKSIKGVTNKTYEQFYKLTPKKVLKK